MPPRWATTRSARHAGTGADLPLRTCSPTASKAIAALAARIVGLADQHGARRCDRLEPGRGVDEIAGDHALVRRADRDRRLAGQHPGPRLDRGAERAHRVDQIEGGAHAALGVVLARGRAPQTAITASPMNFSTVPP